MDLNGLRDLNEFKGIVREFREILQNFKKL